MIEDLGTVLREEWRIQCWDESCKRWMHDLGLCEPDQAQRLVEVYRAKHPERKWRLVHEEMLVSSKVVM